MADGPGDDDSLSPEDLKTLGLGGRGDLGAFVRLWVRVREDLGAFRQELRPSWRGLLGTILICMLLAWLGRYLYLVRQDFPWPAGLDRPDPTPWGEYLQEAISQRLRSPWLPLMHAVSGHWDPAGFAIAPLLAFIAGLFLFRPASGAPSRLWIGALVLASSVAAIAWPLAGCPTGDPASTWVALLFPSAAITLAAGALSHGLVQRATRLSNPQTPFRQCAVSLLLAVLLTRGVSELFFPSLLSFAWAWELGVEPGIFRLAHSDGLQTIHEIAAYVTTALSALLLFLPSLVVLRGHTVRSALSAGWRILIRRPAALFLSLVGLALIAQFPLDIPLGWYLQVSFMAETGIRVFPETILAAIIAGLRIGLFTYAVALAFTALHDSELKDRVDPRNESAG